MSAVSSIVTVARREYLIRVRTRTFVLGTILLVLGVAAIGMLPVIIKALDQTTATTVVVSATEPGLAEKAATSIGAILNTPTGTATPDPAAEPAFTVSVAPGDLAAARQAVVAGDYDAVLAIERTAAGDVAFTYFPNDPSIRGSAGQVRQAASAFAISDRLGRLGVAPTDQAGLFAPPDFGLGWPDPAKTDPVEDTPATIGKGLLSFAMTILIFMMVIMYGNWIAASVVEEKSSRVMEVVLNAVTPFHLLTGKVFGVGAVAFTQFAAVVAAGGLSLLLQGSIGDLVLGTPGAAAGLPQGLTPELLVAFGVFGILGFLLYATLFAAAGSLVSRQEDVGAAVMPLTLMSTAGYMIGVYAALGLLDIHAAWVLGLTLFPFLAPFMMLGRIAVGAAAPWEIVVSLGLLVATLGGALWVAARIYAVGVLLNGSRPGYRAIWRLLREGM